MDSKGKRLAMGFGWGVVAAIAMAILTILGHTTGISPIPKPIPLALVAKVVGLVTGGKLAMPLLIALAAASHLAYGGVWGAVLWALTRPVTMGKALGLGLFLWLLMQVIVLPFLGWGVFGSAVSLGIAGATLILHLVYAITLGAAGSLRDRTQRSRSPHTQTHARASAPSTDTITSTRR